jgi:hypothetical protein
MITRARIRKEYNAKIGNCRIHDTRHALRLLRTYHKARRLEYYGMDTGYDSEALHRLIREELKADSILPVRSWKNEFVGGIYPQEMALHFDDVRYPRKLWLKPNSQS